MQLFPYSNIIVGILVFILGFLFHWIGQIISVINWPFAIKLGIQEKKCPPEFVVYEKAIAMADVFIGWIYGLAAIGIISDQEWAYKVLWFPGIVFIYHGVFFWFMIGYQNKLGKPTTNKSFRVIWTGFNLLVGLLAVLMAW